MWPTSGVHYLRSPLFLTGSAWTDAQDLFAFLHLAGQSQVVIVFAFALSRNDFWYNWYMLSKSKGIVERWVSIFGC